MHIYITLLDPYNLRRPIICAKFVSVQESEIAQCETIKKLENPIFKVGKPNFQS